MTPPLANCLDSRPLIEVIIGHEHPQHPVATSQLPRLIDRTLKGEPAVISLDGGPVVEPRPIPAAPRPLTLIDLEWIDSKRVGKAPADLDAASEVRRIRDEGA